MLQCSLQRGVVEEAAVLVAPAVVVAAAADEGVLNRLNCFE